jgi:hypothetical protein
MSRTDINNVETCTYSINENVISATFPYLFPLYIYKKLYMFSLAPGVRITHITLGFPQRRYSIKEGIGEYDDR